MSTHPAPSSPARCARGLLLAAIWWICGCAGALAAEIYSFAVVPQFESRRLVTIWQPIVDELQRRTGIPLKLLASLSVTEFETAWSTGSFDFAYLNPSLVLRELKRDTYLPLVRDELPLRGILVVRKDSPIRSLVELNGKTLAVPSINALAASVMTRAELKRNYGVEVKTLNAKTHTSAFLHAATGLVDAAGGSEKTFNEQDQEIRDALRILYTTRELPSHPVAAHQRVPAAIREKVRKALLDMAADPATARLLAPVPVKKLVAASIEDYRVMEQWGLEDYWVDQVQPP